MFLLTVDETNLESTDESRFFIVGALVIPVDALPRLDSGMRTIRKEYGFESGDSLKFALNARPSQVTAESFKRAKQSVLDLCIEVGADFIAYLVHHDVARNQSKDRNIEFGLNTILYQFDSKYLPQHGGKGICLIDRTSSKDHGMAMLKRRFQYGLDFNGRRRPLVDVLLYGVTADGASHISSAADVVLGAFRYCVNRRDGGPVPEQLFSSIAQLLWKQKISGNTYLRNYGLLLRPVQPASGPIRLEYEALVDQLTTLDIRARDEQTIDVRDQSDDSQQRR